MRLTILAATGLALAGCDASSPETRVVVTEAPAAAISAPSTSPVTIAEITAGSRVVSPVRLTGTAPGAWYGEAVFDVKLIDASGAVVGQYPARATIETWYEGVVPWAASLVFTVAVDTPATLVLTQDQTGEDAPQPQQVRIPVILAPG